MITNKIFIPPSQMHKYKLRPIIEYKGPILKLNVFEKEEINLLQKQIYEYRKEIDILKKYKETKSGNHTYKNFFQDRISSICTSIENLEKRIRKIKLNRIEKQRTGKPDFEI